ncbi:MAG TPA: DUF2958 domain-containing protein [Porphyromonadaceae bacterium]|nr:DUF2958 domain-containing protein [Porphyromonadaceae bacterium]
MRNQPSKDRLARIPRLYATAEHTPLQDKLIHLHLFVAGCDFYIAEYDGQDILWGFTILNNDYQCAEWGYVSLEELKSIKVAGFMEIDCELEQHWRIRPAIEVDKIRKAHDWQYQPAAVSTRMETETL